MRWQPKTKLAQVPKDPPDDVHWEEAQPPRKPPKEKPETIGDILRERAKQRKPLGEIVKERHGVWQYPFNRARRDPKEGWYLDWFSEPGAISDLSKVSVGDQVADDKLNMTPYWAVSFVDQEKGRIYVDPLESNPFTSGMGAGGHRFTEVDYDVYSGKYERERVDQVLDAIRNGEVSSYGDVKYLLLGTVPVQMGPNGAQGGWYNPEDTSNNRGGSHKDPKTKIPDPLNGKQIMAADAKKLAQMGFDVPPNAVDGTLEVSVWRDLVGGGVQQKDYDKVRLAGEDYSDPRKCAEFLLAHPQPDVKYRNLDSLMELFDQYPRKQINDLYFNDKKEEAERLQEAWKRGEFRDKKIEAIVRETLSRTAALEHPTFGRTGFDPYWNVKENAILYAQRFGWMDILRAHEKDQDPSNRRYVVEAYGKNGDLEGILRMEGAESHPEVLRAILSSVHDLNGDPGELIAKDPGKYSGEGRKPSYHDEDLAVLVRRYSRPMTSSWVLGNCKFAGPCQPFSASRRPSFP